MHESERGRPYDERMSRRVVEAAAQHVQLHLAPLRVTLGQLTGGAWAFRADTGDGVLQNDYILVDGVWRWREAPTPELPRYTPQVRAVFPARGDGTNITAFIAYQLGAWALDVLSPIPRDAAPVDPMERLEWLAQEAVAGQDPVVARKWWDVSVFYLVQVATGRLASQPGGPGDATVFLRQLRLDDSAWNGASPQ